MTTWTRTGRSIRAPLGMARSDPPMPTGTIGTLARSASQAGPSLSGWMVGPDWRAPSGNRTNGSPPASTSSHRRRASRSAAARLTPNAPRALNSQPVGRYFHIVSLPM
jgi:hypothetical protein